MTNSDNLKYNITFDEAKEDIIETFGVTREIAYEVLDELESKDEIKIEDSGRGFIYTKSRQMGGSYRLLTGRGGMEMFEKAFKKEFNSYTWKSEK